MGMTPDGMFLTYASFHSAEFGHVSEKNVDFDLEDCEYVKNVIRLSEKSET